MRKKNEITDEEYSRIKENLSRFSYIDLIIWRNEMINSGEIYNRLFDLLNEEILNRASRFESQKKESKSK